MQQPQNDTFSFRWGIDILDAAREGTFVYRFLLRHYAALGVSAEEMMFIIHLSDYHYDTPNGAAKPSLSTIGKAMGHDTQYARRLKRKLIAKGLLQVIEHPGFPDEYLFAELSKRAFELWQTNKALTPVKSDTPIKTDRGTPISGDRGGVSNLIGEKEQSNTNNKKTAPAVRNSRTRDTKIQRAVNGKLRARLHLNPNTPGDVEVDEADVDAVLGDMRDNPYKCFLPELGLRPHEQQLAYDLATLFGFSDQLIGAGCRTRKQRDNERAEWRTVCNLLTIANGDAALVREAAEYFKMALMPTYSFRTPESLRKTLITWVAKKRASPEGDQLTVDVTDEYVQVETPLGVVYRPVGAK